MFAMLFSHTGGIVVDFETDDSGTIECVLQTGARIIFTRHLLLEISHLQY